MVCVVWKGVWCLLSAVNSLCVVACVSVWCACCLVVLCVVCGMAVCEDAGVCGLVVPLLLSVFLFFFVLVFGVVRAQPCEHARYPRTPLCFSILLCCLFSVPRPSSRPAFPVIVEWRWGVHHVLVCCVGMTAMGSLSLSFSFFW